MVRIPTNRAPTHPGEMLREEFLIPMNVITQQKLADDIHVPISALMKSLTDAAESLPAPRYAWENFSIYLRISGSICKPDGISILHNKKSRKFCQPLNPFQTPLIDLLKRVR